MESPQHRDIETSHSENSHKSLGAEVTISPASVLVKGASPNGAWKQQLCLLLISQKVAFALLLSLEKKMSMVAMHLLKVCVGIEFPFTDSLL